MVPLSGALQGHDVLDEAGKAERHPRDPLILRHDREAPDGHRLPCEVPDLIWEGGRRE